MKIETVGIVGMGSMGHGVAQVRRWDRTGTACYRQMHSLILLKKVFSRGSPILLCAPALHPILELSAIGCQFCSGHLADCSLLRVHLEHNLKHTSLLIPFYTYLNTRLHNYARSSAQKLGTTLSFAICKRRTFPKVSLLSKSRSALLQPETSSEERWTRLPLITSVHISDPRTYAR